MGRLVLVVAFIATGMLVEGPVGMTATCLAVIAGVSCIAAVVDVVACRWFWRLVAYRELWNAGGH